MLTAALGEATSCQAVAHLVGWINNSHQYGDSRAGDKGDRFPHVIVPKGAFLASF